MSNEIQKFDSSDVHVCNVVQTKKNILKKETNHNEQNTLLKTLIPGHTKELLTMIKFSINLESCLVYPTTKTGAIY
mgnify:CR=1 FL=1